MENNIKFLTVLDLKKALENVPDGYMITFLSDYGWEYVSCCKVCDSNKEIELTSV